MPDAPKQSLADEAGMTAAVDAAVFNFATVAALPLGDEAETAPVFRA